MFSINCSIKQYVAPLQDNGVYLKDSPQKAILRNLIAKSSENILKAFREVNVGITVPGKQITHLRLSYTSIQIHETKKEVVGVNICSFCKFCNYSGIIDIKLLLHKESEFKTYFVLNI